MTRENRDIFAARLRHELTQETHVVVGDHPPERKRWRDRPVYSHTLAQDTTQRRASDLGFTLHNMEIEPGRVVRTGTMSMHEYKTGRFEPRDVAERQLDLYSFALTGGPRIPDVVIQDEHIFYGADEELAAIEGAAFHPLGDAERDRQFAKLTALPVNQATQLAAAPVDSPICKCHDRMGNDWYFLPTGFCLFDINECTDPTRRQTKP